MGFISLMLLVFEDQLVRICVPVETQSLGIPCCMAKASNEAAIRSQLDSCLALATNSSAQRTCNQDAMTDWRSGRGFTPAIGSSLVDVCPAPGQSNMKLA